MRSCLLWYPFFGTHISVTHLSVTSSLFLICVAARLYELLSNPIIQLNSSFSSGTFMFIGTHMKGKGVQNMLVVLDWFAFGGLDEFGDC
jgi:hypothetical protein